MRKFEYTTIVFKSDRHTTEDEDTLNELGERGWELVSVTSEIGDSLSIAYLKREIQQEPEGEQLRNGVSP